jgi:hypothetical protein
MEASPTQKLILKSGKRMFLKRGFKSAPLRSIVKEAGYTLGAFYGYYKSKEELFYALTDEVAKGFKNLIESVNKEVVQLPPERMIFEMMDLYLNKLPEIADYIYAHKDEMLLLIKCSAGTKYEGFFATFSERNKELIKTGVERAKAAGVRIHGLETDTFELLMRSYSEIMANIIIEGRDKKQILRMMKEVGAVYRNGMLSLMEEREKLEAVQSIPCCEIAEF